MREGGRGEGGRERGGREGGRDGGSSVQNYWWPLAIFCFLARHIQERLAISSKQI